MSLALLDLSVKSRVIDWNGLRSTSTSSQAGGRKQSRYPNYSQYRIP